MIKKERAQERDIYSIVELAYFLAFNERESKREREKRTEREYIIYRYFLIRNAWPFVKSGQKGL